MELGEKSARNNRIDKMKRIIDLETWSRKNNFEFFKDFLNPYMSITCNVQVRHAKELAKQRGESFFLYYLYAILYAFNNIEQFKYRIDPDGNIVCYDKIDAISPIQLDGMKTFASMRFPYIEDKNEFYRNCKQIIAGAAEKQAYSAENTSSEYDLVCISALPKLAFTSVSFANQKAGGAPFPLLNVGKMGSDFNMPIAVFVHHGFVDGEHLTNFFETIEQVLATY